MLGQLLSWLKGGAADNGDGTFTITHAGKPFRFPMPEGRELLLGRVRSRGGFYEPDLLAACEQQVQGRDGLCLDIGANVGNHSLYFAGVMGRQTVAFEPVSSNRSLLERVRDMNPDAADRITVVPYALSDAPATLWMSKADEGNPGTFHIANQTAQSEEVRALRLDDYMDEAGLADTQIALIKIDVEGHEPAVLRGAERTLKRSDCILTLEASSLEDYRQASQLVMPHGFGPVGVYCATPTVMFAKGVGTGAEAQILARISKHERKGKSR